MSLQQDVTPALRDWLREPDGLPPPRIAEVAPLVHQTPQQRGVLPPLPRRFRTMFQAITWVAAGLVVALFGGLLISGALTSREGDALLPGTTDSAVPSDPMPTPTTVATEPPPGPVAEGVMFEHVAGDAPQLVWTGYPTTEAWWDAFGDGSAPIEASWQGTTVRASDGSYRAEHGAPGFDPIQVEVTHPDGSRTSSTIGRPASVSSIAVGPAGIVVLAGTAIDATDIAELMVPDYDGTWDDHGFDFDAPRKDRFIRVDPPTGKPVRLTYDEIDEALKQIGLGVGDYESKDYAWHSTDGRTWKRVKEVDRASEVVATDEGFIARIDVEDGDGYLTRSSNGIDWTRLDLKDPGSLLSWNGQVLVHDGGYLGRVNGSRVEDLPLTDAVFGRDGAFRTASATRTRPDPEGFSRGRWHHAASELGIVSVDWKKGLLMYSPDGEHWSLVRLPDDWVGCGWCLHRPVRATSDAMGLVVGTHADDGDVVPIWLGRADGAVASETVPADPAGEPGS